MRRFAALCGDLVRALVLAGGSLAMLAAQAAVPYAHSHAHAIDVGELAAQAGQERIDVTITLALRDPAAAESLLQSLTAPGDPQYGRFLSSDEFVARFAPTAATVAMVIEELARHGLAAERSGATTLRASGTVTAMESTFAVSLHHFLVPEQRGAPAYAYHAPLSRARIPQELSGVVTGVAGLDNRPVMHSHLMRQPRIAARQPQARTASSTGNAFGSLTVVDFADQYDVQPLYSAGVTGSGRMIGILTFASFLPSDAFAYWTAVGLSVDPQRLTIVNVDGGPGPRSDSNGSDETTLDVEQAGGVAPGAKLILYQGPNTNQGFVDVLARAVDDNLADTLSISWGQWEWFDGAVGGSVSDPSTGQTVGAFQAAHELLLRAAIQGQTVLAAAGDGGAYEVNHDLGCYGPESAAVAQSCSLALSVSYPATDPAITAAGGTTLPGTARYCVNSSCTGAKVSVPIAQEQAWGWDYLGEYCAKAGTPDPVACGIFGVGGGGGVSILFAQPSYQIGLRGLRTTQPQQMFRSGTYFVQNDGLPALYMLPGGFPGRNIPDISANADPNTGYEVYYTSSAAGSTLAVISFYGGTSFVAPQLNGVAALLGQHLHGRRLGLLNPALYRAALGRHITGGGAPVVRSIDFGDNWFWFGHSGYNQAAGLGVLDVARFAAFLGAAF